MMSIYKMHGGLSQYYGGVDNYYSQDSQEPGMWFGKTTQHLGLVSGDSVNNEQFDNLAKGFVGDQILGRTKNGEVKHVSGWDHTFSAPKSISLLSLVGGDTRLIDAHNKAVDSTLQHIENHIISTRKRYGGIINIERTGNLIAAKWLHDISRKKDPQLHTHATILNITFDDSNQNFRSLESSVNFENKMLLGAIYQSELALEVQKLGYEIKLNNNGTFDIRSVNRYLIEKASTRRKEILESMKEHGVTGSHQAAIATLLTRPSKEELTKEERNDLWQTEHADNKQQLVDAITSSKANLNNENYHRPKPTLTIKGTVDYAINHLEENEAVMLPRDIARMALISQLGSYSKEQVFKEIKKRFENGNLLLAKYTEDVNIMTKTSKHERAYITPKMLDLEHKVMRNMLDAKKTIPSIFKNPPKLKREDLFTPGQNNATKMILTTVDRFVMVQGLAGTGKTFMLQEVLEQATKQGITVRGMSVSAKATENLEKETGIESTTVQKHIVSGYKAMNSKEEVNFENKEIWVVDESSFISSKQANSLVSRAIAENVRVVFLGDKQQKGSVEAGRPFANMQNEKYNFSVAVMKDIMRQKNEALLRSVKYAYKGEMKNALDSISTNVVETRQKNGLDNPILRRKKIATLYGKLSVEERKKTLVIDPSNDGRKLLNEDIRDIFKKTEVLDTNQQLTTIKLESSNFTRAQKVQVFNYTKGQIIRFVREYDNSFLKVEKDSYHTITFINQETNELTIKNVLATKNESTNEPVHKTIIWNPKKVAGRASHGMEVYNQLKFEINAGDNLIWKRSDNPSQRYTGEEFTVNKITGQNIYFENKDGKEAVVNMDEQKNQHLDYAYVFTTNAAQGLTFDNVIANYETWRGKAIDKKGMYVTLSRARHNATIYTDDRNKLEFILTKNTGDKQSALEQKNDKRLNYFEKRIDILRESGMQITAFDLVKSKEIRDKADLLLVLKDTKIDQLQLNENITRFITSKDIIHAFDVIGNKINPNDLPNKDIAFATHFAHETLKRAFKENDYLDVLDKIKVSKGEILLPKYSDEMKYQKFGSILKEKHKTDYSLLEIKNNPELQKEATEEIHVRDISKLVDVITKNTDLDYQDKNLSKEKQLKVDYAHRELQTMCGKEFYSNLLTSINEVKSDKILLSTEINKNFSVLTKSLNKEYGSHEGFKPYTAIDVMNSTKLQEKGTELQRLYYVEGRVDLIINTHDHKSFMPKKEHQDMIDTAHFEIKNIVGDKCYKELLQDLNQTHTVEFSSKMLPRNTIVEDHEQRLILGQKVR